MKIHSVKERSGWQFSEAFHSNKTYKVHDTKHPRHKIAVPYPPKEIKVERGRTKPITETAQIF